LFAVTRLRTAIVLKVFGRGFQGLFPNRVSGSTFAMAPRADRFLFTICRLRWRAYRFCGRRRILGAGRCCSGNMLQLFQYLWLGIGGKLMGDQVGDKLIPVEPGVGDPGGAPDRHLVLPKPDISGADIDAPLLALEFDNRPPDGHMNGQQPADHCVQRDRLPILDRDTVIVDLPAPQACGHRPVAGL